VKGDKSARTAFNDTTRTGSDDTRPTGGDTRPTGDDTRPMDDTRPTGDDVPTSRPAQLSKAQQLLLKNDNLRAKMAARLPGTIDPVQAARGFKNLGQFVAAVNVSNNQGIDFFALKRMMVGQSLSLGQAVQRLKGVDAQTANAAVDTATTAATRDMAAPDVDTSKQKTKRNGRG
jgi:hypothetical protein